MSHLSTAAWVAHDLGTSLAVGGALFGRLALEPSVRNISDRRERGQVVNDAWSRFGVVQLAASGVMAATWLAGRLELSGREVNASARWLVLAKDVLVGATVFSGVAAAITGSRMAAQHKNGAVPMNKHGEPAKDASPAAQRLGRITDAFGLVNLVAGVGVIAVTTMLAMSAGKSARWSVASRLLP